MFGGPQLDRNKQWMEMSDGDIFQHREDLKVKLDEQSDRQVNFL